MTNEELPQQNKVSQKKKGIKNIQRESSNKKSRRSKQSENNLQKQNFIFYSLFLFYLDLNSKSNNSSSECTQLFSSFQI